MEAMSCLGSLGQSYISMMLEKKYLKILKWTSYFVVGPFSGQVPPSNLIAGILSLFSTGEQVVLWLTVVPKMDGSIADTPLPMGTTKDK